MSDQEQQWAAYLKKAQLADRSVSVVPVKERRAKIINQLEYNKILLSKQVGNKDADGAKQTLDTLFTLRAELAHIATVEEKQNKGSISKEKKSWIIDALSEDIAKLVAYVTLGLGE